jgi:hypothetical protein
MSSKYGFQGPGERLRQGHDQQAAESAEAEGRTDELERMYGSIDANVRDLLKDFLSTVDKRDLPINRGEVQYPTYSSDPPHLAICWNVGDAYKLFPGSTTTPLVYPLYISMKYDNNVIRMFAETKQTHVFSNGNMNVLRGMLEQVTGLRVR